MNYSRRTSRRKFLKHAAAASSALTLPMYVPARVLGREGAVGANEEILIGFIGSGGRARQLMDQVPAGGRIVAISDCYLDSPRTGDSTRIEWPVTMQRHSGLRDRQSIARGASPWITVAALRLKTETTDDGSLCLHVPLVAIAYF